VLVQLPGEVSVPQIGVIVDMGHTAQLVTAVLQSLVIERGRVEVEAVQISGRSGAA